MKKMSFIGFGAAVFLSFCVGDVASGETIHKVEKQANGASGVVIERVPIIEQTKESASLSRSALPEKFDPDNGNVQTLMRDQVGDLCWAYSAVDVITISNKKEFGVEYTLSPNYYNYYSARGGFSDYVNPYGTRNLNSGGEADLVFIQNLLNKPGTLESTFSTPIFIPNPPKYNGPMEIADFKEKESNPSSIHIEEMEKIHGLPYESYTEAAQMKKVNEMKQKIHEHGSVNFSYYTDASHNGNYFNAEKKASYVPITDIGSSLVRTVGDRLYINHGIVIIGWDDHYSKTNFTQSPKKNGAFLVKNSWGSYELSKYDYFYVSYEDAYIFDSDNITVDTKMGQYDNVNTYVNARRTHYVDISTNTKSLYLGASYETGSLSEKLKAVSFYSEQKKVSYEVYYIDGAIQTRQTIVNHENMRKIAVGTMENAGMKEIQTEEVTIPANQEYSVIIKVSYPQDVNSFHLVLQEVRDASQSQYPDLPEGKTFLSMDNAVNKIYWRGLSNGDFGGDFKGNIYINAYTDAVIPVETIKINPESVQLAVGDIKQFTATITPENATNKKVSWESENPSVATVDSEGSVVAVAKGSTKIRAISEDGLVSTTAAVIVVDSKPATSVSILNKKNPYVSYLNNEQKIDVAILPADTTQKELVFESADPAIVQINEQGVITGKGFGTTTIKVSVKGNPSLYDTMNVVTDDHKDSLEQATEVTVGELMHGTYDIKFDFSSKETFTWGDIDFFKFVAPADGTYVLHGSAVKPDGLQDGFELTAWINGTSVISTYQWKFSDFTEHQLKQGDVLTWKILGSKQTAPGSSTIVFLDSTVGTKYNFLVEKKENIQFGELVVTNEAGLSVDQLNQTLKVGDQLQLKGEVLNTTVVDPFYKRIVWSSSNKNVAEIDYNTGLLMIKGPGTVKLTAKNSYGVFVAYSKLSKSISLEIKQ